MTEHSQSDTDLPAPEHIHGDGLEGYSIREERYISASEIAMFIKRHPTPQARLAMALVERWGMVAGMPDGEDTAGRAKLRLLSPHEIVERACQTADLMYAAIEQAGWLMDLPTPREAHALLAAEAAVARDARQRERESAASGANPR